MDDSDDRDDMGDTAPAITLSSDAIADGFRVRIGLTAIGAAVGAGVALLATGILVESVVVLLAAAAGWCAGLALSIVLSHRRRAPESPRSRDELYRRAQQLDIPGRSSMDRDELATAVAASEREATTSRSASRGAS